MLRLEAILLEELQARDGVLEALFRNRRRRGFVINEGQSALRFSRTSAQMLRSVMRFVENMPGILPDGGAAPEFRWLAGSQTYQKTVWNASELMMALDAVRSC